MEIFRNFGAIWESFREFQRFFGASLLIFKRFNSNFVEYWRVWSNLRDFARFLSSSGIFKTFDQFGIVLESLGELQGDLGNFYRFSKKLREILGILEQF